MTEKHKHYKILDMPVVHFVEQDNATGRQGDVNRARRAGSPEALDPFARDGNR